jgi:lysophospholipase L1-like esterase
MRRWLVSLALGAALAVAACGGHSATAPTPPPADGGSPTPPPVPPPPPPPTLAHTTFLAFGDSLTEGAFGTEHVASLLGPGAPTSYPFQLGALLSARYTSQSITVWNAGKGGEAAADAPPRLAATLDEAHPQVLLLLDGINDIGRGSSIQTATDRVEDLVRAASGRGVIVMVATYPPERPGPSTQPGVPPRGDNAAVVPPFNDALRKMAQKKGALLVDIYPQFDLSLLGPDGLHPTADGYARMADIFLAAIRAAWEQPPSVY